MSFEVIPAVPPAIEHLILDPDITEIMVNGSRRVFIERAGLLEEVQDVRVDERNLKVAVKNIARALGDDVSEEKAILDSRLPDGSRLAAVFPPCSVGGTTLTIRKFQTKVFTADELVRIGTLTPDVLAAVRGAIEANQNILISGGTSTGKTTLLNALAAFLPLSDRVVLIEDTAELHIDRPEPRPLRGAAGTGRAAGRHDPRAAPRHAASPTRPHHRGRGAAGKRSIFCRRSTRGIPGRSRRFTRTPPSRPSRDTRRASSRAASNCRTRQSGTRSPTRSIWCCTSHASMARGWSSS